MVAATRDLQAPGGAGRRLAGTWAPPSPLGLGPWWWLLLTLARGAYRGHPSLPNASVGCAPPPPPRAACLFPLCTFTRRLFQRLSSSFSLPTPHTPGLDLIFIFKSSLKKFPRNPSEQERPNWFCMCVCVRSDHYTWVCSREDQKYWLVWKKKPHQYYACLASGESRLLFVTP